MAAIAAADRGERVTLLEKNTALGRKILISGNGRCNLMNLDQDPCHYHGSNPDFARHALNAFPVERSLHFFRDLGIETRVEDRGRVFPMSNRASSVAELLEDRARTSGVRIVQAADATEIRGGRPFRVRALDGRCFSADRVILAAGGKTAPSLGGSEDGIRIARDMGHRCTPLFPGLVPLETERSVLHKLQGVRMTVSADATVDGRVIKSDEWELLFRFYGLSGPVILNLSEAVAPFIGDHLVVMRLNFFPGFTPDLLDGFLRTRWTRHPHRSAAFSFSGVLPEKVPQVLLPLTGISPDQRVGEISSRSRRQLVRCLTGWDIRITDTRSFAEAEVMVGGLSTEEVNPRTLESKIVPGLYFAGEMLDVHGDLGGFNFQWAWSSGWVAGWAGNGPE